MQNSQQKIAKDSNGDLLSANDKVLCLDDSSAGDTGETFDLEKGTTYQISMIYNDESLSAPMIVLKDSESGAVFPERFAKVSNHPKEVTVDLNSGFIITDIDDNYQRCKVINKHTFNYKKGTEATGDLVNEVIDVNSLTNEEKEEAVSGYYGSLESLREEVRGNEIDFNMLIAECYFETELVEPI